MRRRPSTPASTPTRVLLASGLVVAALVFHAPAGTLVTLRELPASERLSWTTYGFDDARSGANPGERLLNGETVRHLHMVWRVRLDGVSIAQLVVAGEVRVGGIRREVVYAVTEHGVVEAVDVASGRPLWIRRLGFVSAHCGDMPDERYGASGTPVVDPQNERLYVASSERAGVRVHALDLATGREAPGWPVTLSSDAGHMHVWGGLTLSKSLIYAGFAGLCDVPPYFGKIVAIDTARSRASDVWFAARDGGLPVGGGGIWGYGGVAVDSRSGAVYAATGNALYPFAQGHPDAESIVRLSSTLTKVAADQPRLDGLDADFGSTPALFRAPGCPPQLAVVNKTGGLYLYDRDRVEAGPVQRIRVAGNRAGGLGLLIGVAAYWAPGRMLYVSDPGPDVTRYRHGLLAFREGSDCRLDLEWQQTVGPEAETTFSSPTLAGGVVYFADGTDGRVFAFDARTGQPLWDSGSSLPGSVFAAPSVVNGRLFVATWDGDRWGMLAAFSS